MGSRFVSLFVGIVVALVLAGSASPDQPATLVSVLVVKATWGPQPVANVGDLTGPTTAFYADASFGSVQLAFTETPWITAYADQSICDDRPGIVDQGQTAAASYEPQSYDHVIYITPCRYVDFGSDALHRGTVGLPATAALFEHELGHTFGISHAGALDCSTKRCTLDPYGNPLDVMGNGVGDFGALQKIEAGWPLNTLVVKVPGTYRLAALEQQSPLPQALIVHRGNLDIWIEHREAIGNDAYLRKSIWSRVTRTVLVHETVANPTAVPFNQRRPDILLGNGGPRGLWLMHGTTFSVPHVVTITVTRHTGTTVTVRLARAR